MSWNKSITYTYNAGGNITKRTVYPYTTGTLGTQTSNYDYVYGNTNWKDQLTSYEGKPITYDAKGYNSFRQAKRALGNPGPANQWHHIVEQNQIQNSGFAKQMVHNSKNLISVSKDVHHKISGYYSTRLPDMGGITLREWLRGRSFDFQYQYGLDVIKMFM